MASIHTIPDIIEIAKVSGYLAADDVAKGSLFSPRIDPALPKKLYMERKAVEWMYGQDVTYDTLRATSNYLYALCGLYAIRAAYIISQGGGGTVVVPGADADGPIWIRITSADFANSTDWLEPDVDGETFFLIGNWISRVLYPDTEWEYISGGGFRILIPGFDATADNYEIYLVKRKLSNALANSVDYDDISGKPLQGLTWDLTANTLITNPSFGTAFQTISVTVIPNGYSYTWDTNFVFSSTWPEQPSATSANTAQIYIFTYIASQSKWLCTGQSIDIPI